MNGPDGVLIDSIVVWEEHDSPWVDCHLTESHFGNVHHHEHKVLCVSLPVFGGKDKVLP